MQFCHIYLSEDKIVKILDQGEEQEEELQHLNPGSSADLTHLWAFNLLTKKWQKLIIQNAATNFPLYKYGIETSGWRGGEKDYFVEGSRNLENGLFFLLVFAPKKLQLNLNFILTIFKTAFL
jgi:hypothetical protein